MTDYFIEQIQIKINDFKELKPISNVEVENIRKSVLDSLKTIMGDISIDVFLVTHKK